MNTNNDFQHFKQKSIKIITLIFAITMIFASNTQTASAALVDKFCTMSTNLNGKLYAFSSNSVMSLPCMIKVDDTAALRVSLPYPSSSWQTGRVYLDTSKGWSLIYTNLKTKEYIWALRDTSTIEKRLSNGIMTSTDYLGVPLKVGAIVTFNANTKKIVLTGQSTKNDKINSTVSWK